MRFHPRLRILAIVLDSSYRKLGNIRLITIEKMKIREFTLSEQWAVLAMAFSADGSTIATNGKKGLLNFYAVGSLVEQLVGL